MSSFPVYDKFWKDAAEFLSRHVSDPTVMLAPEEFLEILQGACPYRSWENRPADQFDFLVLHKGMLDRFSVQRLQDWVSTYVPVFANEVFVVLARTAVPGVDYRPDVHYLALHQRVSGLESGNASDRSASPEAGVRRFLKGYLRIGEYLLAPKEFLDEFCMTVSYASAYSYPDDFFPIVVLGRSQLEGVSTRRMQDLWRTHVPVYRDEQFLVLSSRAGRHEACDVDRADWTVRNHWVESPNQEDRNALLVTSCNRPWALARSLPQIVVLGAPVLVVDDGSTPDNLQEIRRICDRFGAVLLEVPENRGLACALGAGLGYWLADPGITWISYFQDDVDVHPATLEVMAAVQHPVERPLLTGRQDAVHPVLGSEVIAGYRCLYCQRMPGIHLHGHRDYWRGVLPIPSPYFRAPKKGKGRPDQGSDVDHWITAWAPGSITKRGKYVICVPGLVRTFANEADQSTWGQPLFGSADKPLEGY